MEKRIRSVLKSISWRIVATLTTMLIVFAFTGNLALSLDIGSLELFLKMVAYYIHERIWNLSNFGRDERKI